MREEVLAAILAADKELSRDEPEVAANIGLQLEHMGLTTWSISVRRRIRDSVARISPKNIIHTGAAIGHMTAWLLDHYESKDDFREGMIRNANTVVEKNIGATMRQLSLIRASL